MKINIGFPVWLGNTNQMVAVWVGTTPAEGEGTLKWNGASMNRRTPFGTGSPMTQNFSQHANRHVSFECQGVNVDGQGIVEIEGRSFEIVAKLLDKYDLIIHDSPDLHVLLTGQVVEVDGLPAPVANRILEKGQFAQNNGHALLLCRADYELLNASSGKFYDVRPLQNLPETPELILEQIEKLSHGIAYPLPVNSSGKWKDEAGQKWVDGLGRFLGLEEASASTFQSEFSLAESLAIPAAAATPCPSRPIEGTIGQLFEKALPTETEYLAKFVTHNQELCSQSLFDGGIGKDAIEKAVSIFHTPDQLPPCSNILIGGPTGTGKTFLSEALMLNSVLEKDGRVIYIAPTRSLASERYIQLNERVAFEANGKLHAETDIILSTGEANTHDWRLHKGHFKIAVMVNEKANIFLRPSLEILNGVTLAVIDELHMLSDRNRGAVIDLFIAKIQEERQRRFDDGGLPLRLVGITTDRVLSQDSILDAFTVENVVGAKIGPITLSTKKRPIPVEHNALVYHSNSLVPSRAVHITTCAGDDDVQKSDIQRKETYVQIQAAHRSFAPELSQRRPENFDILLSNLVGQFDGFKKLLVAIPSIPLLKKVASQLKNGRKRKHGVQLADDEWERQILKSGVGQSMANDLAVLAGYGIYLHHSELPMDIREIVTQRFRQKDPHPTGLCEILLATETLFYGVNLATDCVVLTSLKWPREDPANFDVRDDYLSANEFHNILGRAGRPGLEIDSTRQAAFVCLSSEELEGQWPELTSVFDGYYGNKIVEMKSQLLADSDITKIRSDRILSLSDVSYPTFRSIMEALRHMGGPSQGNASIEDITALLKRTVYLNSGRMKTAEQTSIVKKLISKVLECAQEVDLVGMTEGKYVINPTAEALIDTGTKWQSVLPMDRWLSILQELNTNGPVPIELLLPAFVSSPDFWRAASRFCWEQSEKNENPALQSENLRICRKQLLSCLVDLGLQDDEAAEVERSLASLITERAAELPLGQPTYKTAVFYRLTIALIRWVNGDDIDEINLLSVKGLTEKNREAKKKEANYFKEKYTDKASWLAVMCSRYFVVKGKLRAEHKRELPRFAERLRYGVRLQGLPMIDQPKSKLHRGNVAELLRSGVTPSLLLCNPDSILPASLADTVEGLNKDDLLSDVRHFYRDQMQELMGRLQENSTSQQLRAFENQMTKAFDDDFAPEFGDLRNVLNDLIQVSDRLATVLQNDGLSMKVHGKGNPHGAAKDILFHIETESASDQKYSASPGKELLTVNITVPWGSLEPKANRIEVTAFGACVLSYLLGRDFVSLPTLIDFLTENERRLTIVDLAGMDMPTLPAELKETLLRFNEPGT